jgi:tetratricopeptide (TPR) repeat protein
VIEGRAWLDRVLAVAASLPPNEQAVVLHNAALLAWVQGDVAQAEARYTAALELSRTMDDKTDTALALGMLAALAIDRGDLARAAALNEESLALFRALGDRARIAAVLGNLGTVVGQQGDLERAVALSEESLPLYREEGDLAGVSRMLAVLGAYAQIRGAVGRAAAAYREGLALAHSLGYKSEVASDLELLASLVAVVHRAEPGARLYGAAEVIWEETGAERKTSEQEIYDRGVAVLRERLADADFRAAWTAGRALPLEAVIAEATMLAEAIETSHALVR